MDRVRIGTLGAARITPQALVKPARRMDEVTLAGVAARDRERAAAFAEKHGIERVYDDYGALVAAADIDAVYNPLPNGLHADWTLRALDAGKHVLCEKPFTSNAAEAEQVAARADERGLVVMEAFHYRYHPVARRMREIVDSGELGSVRRIETWMCIPLPLKNDIRYRYELGGGATMDVGAYAIHMQRLLAGAEPTVVRARARLASPKVDRWMQADLDYADGRTGTMTCALLSSTLLKIAVRVTGDAGSLHVFNPTGPHLYHRMTVRSPTGRRRERIERTAAKRSTYSYQLAAFAGAVLRGEATLTPATDAVANMRVIDAVYDAAGLPRRGT